MSPPADRSAKASEPPEDKQELLGTVLQEAQSAGSWIANQAKDSTELNIEEQVMLQNFGINFADAAQGLKEILHPAKTIPPMPNFSGEGYNPFPFIRERLRQADIDPDNLNGIEITVIDDFSDNSEHGQQVSSVINDAKYGLIHNAKTTPFDTPEINKLSLEAAEFLDETKGLSRFVSELGTTYLELMTKALQKATAQNDPDESPRLVINLSMGMSNVKLSERLFDLFQQDPDKFRPWLHELIGKEKTKDWIDNLKNDVADYGTLSEPDRQLLQAIQAVVDKELSANKEFQTAQTEYRQATEKLATNGIFLIVAAGNAQDTLSSSKISAEAGAAFNWYAQSDHVIAAGSCNINKTANDRSDDRLTYFSSQGNTRYHPTVLAQGEQLFSQWEGIAGTSFAAPQVSGTIALMLAQNQKLSFSEVKLMLRQNSSLLRGELAQAQGAGVLRIEDAIIAARNSSERR
ncbi:MAG: S8 family serine peptidase [Candidatus Obscuribacterales bacterium]|nr:S8 family serine peptidase [Candidatus Obscuribacterales bacterium]